MMGSVFLEIVIIAKDFHGASVSARQDIEEELNTALEEAALGEVSGGGAGKDTLNIDVDIEDEAHLSQAIALIKNILLGLSVPGSTTINRYKPNRTVFRLDE